MKDLNKIKITLYCTIRAINDYIYSNEELDIQIRAELYFSNCDMPLKRKLSNIANEIYFNQFSMDEYLFYILTRLIYIKSNRLLDETSIWTMKKYNDQFYDGRRLASDLSMIDKIINDKNSSYKKLFFVSPTGTSLMYELVMEKLISPITYINLYEREVRDENLLGFHKRTKEYESFNGKIMNTVLAIRQHVVRLH